MDWLHPEALYFILPLLAVYAGFCLYARLRRQRAAAAFVSAEMAARVLPPEPAGRFWLKTACGGLGLVCLLLALARPRWGETYETIRVKGSDLYVLLDVSKSMLATDVFPNRLERAKSDVSEVLSQMPGQRAGLIAFAGRAAIKCPLTTDHEYLRLILNELGPHSAPLGGTAIGDALRKALSVMPKNREREQAILLITDGDDQDSYPKEAAAQAAERGVVIYAVGLGDPERGALVPKSEKEHTSKLNQGLLSEIASITKGAYIPAGTRDYNLAEQIQRFKGNSAETRRVNLQERYQWPLALGFLLLLVERLLARHPRRALASPRGLTLSTTVKTAALLALLLSPAAFSAEPSAAVRDGLKLYEGGDLDGALTQFAEAAAGLPADDRERKPIAAFNQACVHHRKGERENAEKFYLEAALARDRGLAAAARFNLGVMHAEHGRTLAGEKPETLEPDKRGPVIEALVQAITHFRACLEVQADHAGARRNIELIRLWIRYHQDRWKAYDRQKRRDETNTMQFLEYIIQAEKGLRAASKELEPTSSLDRYAELKRAQEELRDEIEPLKQKIAKDAVLPGQEQGKAPDPKQQEQMQKWLEAVNKLADEAATQMGSGALALGKRNAPGAADAQKQAIEKLEGIWDMAADFNALLQRALKDERGIVADLKPDNASATKKDEKKEPSNETKKPDDATARDTELAELQGRTAVRTHLLKLRAEQMLKELEAAPAPQQPQPPPPQPQPGTPGQPSPQEQAEQAKAGFKKAIELAPKAVEKMTSAAGKLQKSDRPGALPDAEEALKILEEIEKAQPKQDQKNDQKQDQQNQDQQQQQNKDEQQKKDQDKNKDDEKKDKNEKKDEPQPEQGKGEQKKEELSEEQAEAILRRVREREKERRREKEKERQMMIGRTPVENDW